MFKLVLTKHVTDIPHKVVWQHFLDVMEKLNIASTKFCCDSKYQLKTG